MTEHIYGSVYFFGYVVSDNVALDPFGVTLVQNFPFF